MKLTAAQHGFLLVFSVCKHNPRSAGVAFLVASSVCEKLPTAVPRMVRHDGGRLLCMHLNWGGRSLWLVNAYMPCQPAAAKAFIQGVLGPQLVNPPGRNTHTVLLGDWNFVHNPAMDRMRVNSANHTLTPNDRACPAEFAAVAPNMLDTFREKCPGRRACTHAGHFGGARLDRVYVCADMLPFVSRAGIMNVPEYFSDHRPVFVHIVAAEGLYVRGRDVPPRLRCWFWNDPALRHTFQMWVSMGTDNAPDEAANLLQWWPVFKADMAECVKGLNQLHKQRSQPSLELQSQRDSAAQDIAQAWRGLESAVDDVAAEAAMQLLFATRRKWAAAIATMRRHRDSVQPPPPWLHYNETPNQCFTAVMRPPVASKVVHALRHPHGHLVGPGLGQANIMLQHYASISTSPPPRAAALQQVLHAIPAHGPTGLGSGAANALGNECISCAELYSALKHSKPGRSPGDDGIPIELYRRAGPPMVALLAKVLSAMGELKATPPHFLDGVISSIHKADDPTLPSNYRPITLLNTDYRLLAKVLANRCLVYVSHLISREQCTFLKGRNIGESIMLLQLLPHQLAAEGHSGALVAFLDFRKAYDSVNREFLREVLLKIGVGHKFVAWVMLLLSPSTTACAVLNGFKSTKLAFHAGVRQGCPLAPLLYLFVGEALLRFMKAQPELGVVLAGSRHMAAQYADDVDPFLKDVSVVPVLLQTMSVFGDASNQRMNLDKTKLLPVGPPAVAPLPATVDAIPIVANATTLGITFHSGLTPATPKHEWQLLFDKLTSKFRTLGHLPLSAFGRAMGATSYALSKVLFYLEHSGLPPARELAAVQQALAKLVDRANKHGFTYVRKELLVGPAKQGGFGMLDVEQHVTARHAVWAVKLVTGDEEVPWIRVGRALLRHLWGDGWHVILPLPPAAQHPDNASPGNGNVPMPAPLARIFRALHKLPDMHDVVAPAPLHPMDPPQDALDMLINRMGWKVREVGSDVPIAIPLTSLTVRMAYRMLLQPTVDMRVQRWKQFIADSACIDVASVDDAMTKQLHTLLGMVWRRVKWSNGRKQLFWQLVVDGIPTSARRNTGAACYCSAVGHLCPDRSHHFWHCPVASAVVAEICKCLGVAHLHRKHIWLMQPPEQMMGLRWAPDATPSSSVRRAVKEAWMVVCLAAMQAMWVSAKKIMGSETRASLAGQPRGLHIVVVESAVVTFWELLHEFAQSSSVPGSWRRLLPMDTPFLHFPRVDCRLQVNTSVPLFVAAHVG